MKLLKIVLFGLIISLMWLVSGQARENESAWHEPYRQSVFEQLDSSERDKVERIILYAKINNNYSVIDFMDKANLENSRHRAEFMNSKPGIFDSRYERNLYELQEIVFKRPMSIVEANPAFNMMLKKQLKNFERKNNDNEFVLNIIGSRQIQYTDKAERIVGEFLIRSRDDKILKHYGEEAITKAYNIDGNNRSGDDWVFQKNKELKKMKEDLNNIKRQVENGELAKEEAEKLINENLIKLTNDTFKLIEKGFERTADPKELSEKDRKLLREVFKYNMQSEELRKEREERLAAEIKYQRGFNDRQAAFSLLSMSMRHTGNSEAADVISQTGSAYLDLEKTFREWSKGDNSSISDFAMCTDTVGVVMFVANLVMSSNSGPSIEEVILKQLRQVADMILALEQKMDYRFDNMESLIRTSFSEVRETLADIKHDVKIISENVTVINNRLVRISQKLDSISEQIESNTYDQSYLIINDELKGYCSDLIKEYIENKKEFDDNFKKCLKNLRLKAFDSSSLPPLVYNPEKVFTSTDDEDKPAGTKFTGVAEFLNLVGQLDLSRSLNFYSAFTKTEPMRKRKVNEIKLGIGFPNPDLWYKWTNAYINVYKTFPLLSGKQENVENFNSLLHVGKYLENNFYKKVNKDVIYAAFRGYKTALAKLDESIKNFVSGVEAEGLDSERRLPLTDLNLNKVNMPSYRKSANAEIPICEGFKDHEDSNFQDYDKITMKPYILSQALPKEILLADNFNVNSKLRFCYKTFWKNPKGKITRGKDAIVFTSQVPDEVGTYKAYDRLVIQVTVYWEDNVFPIGYIQMENEAVKWDNIMYKLSTKEVLLKRSFYIGHNSKKVYHIASKRALEAWKSNNAAKTMNFIKLNNTKYTYDKAVKQAQEKLQSHRKKLVRNIHGALSGLENDLTKASSSGLDLVQSKSKEVKGWYYLLYGYTYYSMGEDFTACSVKMSKGLIGLSPYAVSKNVVPPLDNNTKTMYKSGYILGSKLENSAQDFLDGLKDCGLEEGRTPEYITRTNQRLRRMIREANASKKGSTSNGKSTWGKVKDWLVDTKLPGTGR